MQNFKEHSVAHNGLHLKLYPNGKIHLSGSSFSFCVTTRQVMESELILIHDCQQPSIDQDEEEKGLRHPYSRNKNVGLHHIIIIVLHFFDLTSRSEELNS